MGGYKTRTDKRGVGAIYEEKACAFLQTMGYRIITKNFRCRQGEIDLIAREGDTLCFVEVKYRRNSSHGRPEEAVDARKQRRICRVAAFYLYTSRIPKDTKIRFDVVAILGSEITLYKNAFSYQNG